MKKVILLIILILIISGGVLVYYKFSRHKDEPKIMETKNLNKKVLMIIAFQNFKDEEYFVPKEILEKAGVEVITASTEKGTALGVSGGEAEVILSLSEVKAGDFDGVIFIGGPGASVLIDNMECHRIAKEAVAAEKILGAICIAPAILAKAGVLQGKQATVWSSSLDKSAVKILQDNNVNYQDKNVVVDGKIITADGPAAAEEFGKKLIEILK